LSESVSAVLVFALLCASAGLGGAVSARLPERHRTRETIELMQLTIGLLATFAAIVLGLLTASVAQDYDGAAQDRERYALQLTSLDRCLRDYGPAGAAARTHIASYTAAVIASTWPDEKPPSGVAYPNTAQMPRVGATPVLARLMDEVGTEIATLPASDPRQAQIAALCRERYKDVSHDRLAVIEDAGHRLSQPFYWVLAFWLMVIFACAGLVAPRNPLSIAIVILCALSLSSVMFVIVDLSQPYGGFFGIASTSMRDALGTMLQPAP
jgi:hypothetical protein